MSLKGIWQKSELTCRPLDTLSEIDHFLKNPPPWRSLCKKLTPHSTSVIRNIEINKQFFPSLLEVPEPFCHFDQDAESPKRYDVNKVPKTLVCHDMANGYHDDCHIEGTGNESAYSFYHWSGIDIFCYFSHHLITIPPLGWINIGHAHGVKVIGTIITEYTEGMQFWDQLLDSQTQYMKFATSLVAIAKILKFDGWLLNIENKVNKPDQLLDFVAYFHQVLHKELDDPLLVWYDSVTINGVLNWQNGLNEKNKAFFDICDAFFTNYSWSEENIVSSVEAAEDRVHDLYIGIDVWGRNFHGGGQFNVQEAIKIVHGHRCSIAIFAPAWTHEAMSQEKDDINAIAMSDNLDKYEVFLLRDRALWSSIWRYLNTRLPCALPFQTSFCKGQGKKRRLHGEVLCPVPWYNLRHMQYQPNSTLGPHGYILSTYDNIIQASQHGGMIRDTKGIIRYRESFETPKFDSDSFNKDQSIRLRETESTEPAGPVDDNKTGIASNDQNVEEPNKEPKTMKRKIQNAIKHIFKKTSKREDSVAGPSSGKSMIQMSVALVLGRAEKTDKTRYALACVPEDKECLQTYHDDSFIGGSCIKINPSDELSPQHRTIRLFHCDFVFEHSLIAVVVTKSIADSDDHQHLNIRMPMKNSRGQNFDVVLIGRNLPRHAAANRAGSNPTATVNLYPLNAGVDVDFRDMQKYLLLHEPGFYVPIENPYGWTVRYYVLSAPGARVLEVTCRTANPQGAVLLGHFGLCNKTQTSESSEYIPHLKSWGINLL